MNVSRTLRSRHRTLRVQADVPHTFGTLLIPLALLLVVCGIFLVERTIANPLASDISGILFGSVVLACGLLLVAYLSRSVRIAASSQAHGKGPPVEQPKRNRVVHRSFASGEAPPIRSGHRTYVDDVRISL